jgi:hypothetical protein
MIEAVIALPLTYLLALTIAIGLTASLLGILLFEWLFPPPSLVGNNIESGFIFESLEPFFICFILFPLTISWFSYHDITRKVRAEASALQFLKNTAGVFEDAERDRVRSAIDAYVGAVIDDEWGSLAAGRESPLAAAALEHLLQVYADIKPADQRDRQPVLMAVRMLASVGDFRAGRVASAIQPNVKLVAIALLLATTMTLVLGWFYALPTLLTKILLQGVLTVAMMGCVFFVVVLSFPLKSEVAVSREPFLRVLQK